MRYVLRADASQSIGSGHVMRSTAIAEELIARGKEVIFIGEVNQVPWLENYINGIGFSKTYSSYNGFVSKSSSDVLILDSYVIPINDGFIQPENWKSVVVMADEVTPLYKADLVISPGLSTNLGVRAGAKLLAGPRYIPFRSSIQKKIENTDRNSILKILVVGGGTDTFNFVEAVCQVLSLISENFHAHVFSGNTQLGLLDSRLTVNPIGADLDLYAGSADLVFTTASTTSLEFIAREVAVGIGCATDNQRSYYESLTSYGVAVPIGQFLLGQWRINPKLLRDLITSADLRDSLINKGVGLIDLQGVQRIVDEISLLNKGLA